MEANDDLKPGQILNWKTAGPWKVTKIYPWHPTETHKEYRQTVDIEGPDGRVFTVDDVFIATWFTRGGE